MLGVLTHTIFKTIGITVNFPIEAKILYTTSRHHITLKLVFLPLWNCHKTKMNVFWFHDSFKNLPEPI